MQLTQLGIQNTFPKRGSIDIATDYTLDKQVGILLAGQSNAVGTNSDTPSSPFTFPIPSVFMRTTGTNFVPLDYPANNLGANYGSELTLGDAIKSLTSRPVFMAKVAESGAPVAQEVGRNDFNILSNELYPLLRDAALDLKSKITSLGKTPILILVWIQGERDCLNTAMASAWNQNFTDIINQLATDGAAIDYIVLNTLNVNQDAGSQADRDIVIAGQNSYINSHPNTVRLDMDNYALGPDNIHYTGPTQETIGDDVADLIVNNFFSSIESSPYVVDAQSYFYNLSSDPPSAYKTAVNDYISREVTAGRWIYRRYGMFGGLDTLANSLRGITGFLGGTNNGSTHVPKSGWDFDGVNDFIDSGFDFVTQGVGGWAQNNGWVTIWIVTNDATGTDSQACGVFQNASNRVNIAQAPTATSLVWRINTSTSSVYTGETAFAANAGYTARRNAASGANATSLLKNGSVVQNSTQASVGIPTGFNLYVGALNNAGTAGNFYNGTIALIEVGFDIGPGSVQFDYAGAHTSRAQFIADLAAI